MELHKVPNNTKVKLLEDPKTPPASQGLEVNMVLEFKHIDGMYSLCYTKHGEMVHPAAWTEVEIIEDSPGN